MKQQWMPPTPIETLFEQLDDGKLFAAKGREVIDDSQLKRWAYDNVKKTSAFLIATAKSGARNLKLINRGPTFKSSSLKPTMIERNTPQLRLKQLIPPTRF